MNRPHRICLLLLLTASIVCAETVYEKELKQLKEQRDRAIATAADPINRRYKESLDQLLRKATQGNDLDTALKIKTELGTLATVPAATKPTVPASPKPDAPPADPKAAGQAAIALTDLKLQLAGTKWKELVYGGQIHFRPDGKVNWGGGLGKYETKAKDKVTMTIENKKPEIFSLTQDGRHLERIRGVPAFELQVAN